MEGSTIEKPTLRMVNSEDKRPIAEWERMYPELWMLIEVTREDLWEIYEGKLIAMAEDPMELIEIRRSYSNRGIVNLTTRGIAVGEQPAVVTRL